MPHIVDYDKYIQTKLKYKNAQISSGSTIQISDNEYEILNKYDSSFVHISSISDEYKSMYCYGTDFGNTDTELSLDNLLKYWTIVDDNYISKWNRYMNQQGYPGIPPEILRNSTDGRFIRLKCVKTDNSYATAGLRLKDNLCFSNGKFECEVRFNVAETCWPAIWALSTQNTINPVANYYEIDLVEYFYSAHRGIDSAYHNTESYNIAAMTCASTSDIKVNDQKWNKWTCTWDAKSICYYVNDKLLLKIDNDHDPFHYPVTDNSRKMRWILSMQYNFHYDDTFKYDFVAEKYPNNELPKDSKLPLWMDIRNITIYKKI